MLKDLPLSEHIHQHCNESMERALLAERHPLWARSCPELKDIDFIRLGLLRCISVGRHFLQTNEQISGAPCYLTKFRDSCRRNSFTYAANRRCSSRPASATD
ncbi:hypothetical protein [Bathymodiolus japonicus methanotrophic gill symbiont]|uniref:hypothetical protein n=1 Tax=Bathymodiolus japonicus methanotrophic gill symbiont TaxID=113269 RepID=UPI001C8D61AB|nr:hypothetical protein [Bathymodiolus japonicus methanotrophic gill symbiont]